MIPNTPECMTAEKISQYGLTRETWGIRIQIDFDKCRLYLANYSKYTRASTSSRKWIKEAVFNRWNNREHLYINNPPIPEDVIAEAKEYFKSVIDNMEVEI